MVIVVVVVVVVVMEDRSKRCMIIEVRSLTKYQVVFEIINVLSMDYASPFREL